MTPEERDEALRLIKKNPQTAELLAVYQCLTAENDRLNNFLLELSLCLGEEIFIDDNGVKRDNPILAKIPSAMLALKGEVERLSVKRKPEPPVLTDGEYLEIPNSECDNCHHVQHIGWAVRSDLWNSLIRDGGRASADYLCLDCFVMFARQDGVRLSPDDFHWLDIYGARFADESTGLSITTLRTRLDALVTAAEELITYTRGFKINAASRAAQLASPTPIAMWSAKGDQLLDALSLAVAAANNHAEKEVV